MKFFKHVGLSILCIATFLNAQTSTTTDGNTPPAKVKVTLTFQSAHQDGTNLFTMEKAWASSIKNITNNEVSMTLEPQDGIVSSNEILEAVTLGVLDGEISPLVYHSKIDPAFSLLGDMIGAWPSAKALVTFINSGSGISLLSELHDKEVIVLGGITSGVESIPAKVKINGVADFKGIKIRTPPGLVTDIFKNIGANTVALSFNEVKPSLEADVIQATDYSLFSTNHKLGLHKSAKYPIYPGFHSMPLNEVVINKDAWSKISPESQSAIIKSVAELANKMTEALEEEDKQAVAEAQNDPSIEVITWPTDEIDKFRNIAKKEWQKYAKKSEKSKLVYDTVTKHLGLQ